MVEIVFICGEGEEGLECISYVIKSCAHLMSAKKLAYDISLDVQAVQI